MTDIDVFNGDADGICSLVQLRLAEPRDAQLITGIKRDIQLLKRVEAEASDRVTILDISMQKNSADLVRILDSGAKVFYADHHQPGEIPQHSNLTARIDMSATMCTALIVDDYLAHSFHLWAITAAYGDNLQQVADDLAEKAALTARQKSTLRDLGSYLNYNGYGASLSDLFFEPADLYQRCVKYPSPLDFITQESDVFDTLQTGYREDITRADTVTPEYRSDNLAVMILPDAAWARRVSGVWGNELANQYPGRAHLILTAGQSGHYQVSIRAPLQDRQGADKIASQFASGGGRAGAAGINSLPTGQLDRLIELTEQQYG